ncbi:MAG: FISUMP domain-containing protein [Patescibacteria group bacterium]
MASIHSVSALDVGSDTVTNVIQLSSDNPIRIAARIINVFMLLLGVIAVSLVIFAGFKWMTSNGNEENVEAAKKILKNAVIGLAIILSAWGIVTFVLGRLLGDTGNQNGNGGNGGNSGLRLGEGAIGSCTIQSVYPEPEQTDVPRNTAIMVTFKEDVKLDTVCVDASNNPCYCDNTSACEKLNKDNFKIYEGANSASSTDAIVRHPVGDNRTLVVTPILPLGSPAGNVWYTTYLSNDIKATSGCPNGAESCGMFDSCSTDYYRWQFEVNNQLDLTPPQISLGGIFPEPDNLRDTITASSSLRAADGYLQVVNTPNTYIPAQLDGAINSSSANNQPATIVIDDSFMGGEDSSTGFYVLVIPGDKAQLYEGVNPLNIVSFVGNKVSFPGYFTLTVGGDGSHPVGYRWDLTILPARRADTLTIGPDTYTFVNATSSGYNIRSTSNRNQQAIEIASTISAPSASGSFIQASVVGSSVHLTARIAGSAGNEIDLVASNLGPFSVLVTPMRNGSDAVSTVVVKDKKDNPMNSTIQINFSEAVNPVTIAGSAGDVSQTIQVVSDIGTKSDGANCSNNSECLSAKCESGRCAGNYVDGRFEISNGYKTLEFKTNNECGVNGCGEKIYCLPADSNLQVKINAADLSSCATNDDCSTKTPYNNCSGAASFVCGEDVSYGSQNYRTVKIGTQCWFKENLNIGSMINGSGDQNNNDVIEKYCYNNDPAVCAVSGGMYQWNEAMQYSSLENSRGICPTGWHIPNNTDFLTLADYSGGVNKAGGRLKAASPTWNGSDSVGFSGVPSGVRISGGLFVYNDSNKAAFIWTSSVRDASSVWKWELSHPNINFYQGYITSSAGISVRCVQDSYQPTTKTCQDGEGKNYPLARIVPMVGLMDTAFNSLDSNRDGNADGPISFYDENDKVATYKDSYRWSFFVNSQINVSPPKIIRTVPMLGGGIPNLSDPIIIEFDKLILSSTLKSGSNKITIGTTTVEHNLVNLKNTANVPTGYWITSENLDFSPLDGQPDITRAKINHSMLGENIFYSSQVGSGIKDIYQNCFKPSSGPSCTASTIAPSCCNGTAGAILEDGSCAVNN